MHQTQSKDSLDYSQDLKASKDSFTSSPINNFLSSGKTYSEFSSNQKNNDPIKISDEEKEGSSSNRYKQYERALKLREQSSNLKGYNKKAEFDEGLLSSSNKRNPYEKSIRFEDERSFDKRYRDQLYSSAKKIRDNLEESVDEIEKRINQIEREINNSMEKSHSSGRIHNKPNYNHKTTTYSNENTRKSPNKFDYNRKLVQSPPTFKGNSSEKRKETDWSIKEERLLKEIEELRRENIDIKKSLKEITKKVKSSNSEEKEKKSEKEPEAKKPRKKTILKEKNLDYEGLDIEKEIEILYKVTYFKIFKFCKGKQLIISNIRSRDRYKIS